MATYQTHTAFNGDTMIRHDEFVLQQQVVATLRSWGMVVFSIPNERNAGVSDAARMRSTGLTKGAPDLVVLKDNARCIFLELKTPRGKRSPEQEAFAETIQRLGFEYRLVRGIKDIEGLDD